MLDFTIVDFEIIRLWSELTDAEKEGILQFLFDQQSSSSFHMPSTSDLKEGLPEERES